MYPEIMADTTARALRLLALLQARRTWRGPELIDRLGVSERTLRRDIERLRGLGYRVEAITGPAGGYQLDAGSDIPPLLFDDDEAVAIAMGLLTAAGGTIVGIEETSLRALAKLEKVLPSRVRRRINVLQAAVVPRTEAWIQIDAGTLVLLAEACRNSERIRFDYQSRDGAQTERHVEPHRLVSLYQRWYLLAFDRDRQAWRTFRLDRLENVRSTRFAFAPRAVPGGDAAEYVIGSMRSIPTRYSAVATVHAPLSEIEDAITHRGGTLEPIDETSCSVRLHGDHLPWLAFALVQLSAPFSVYEPAELVAYVAELADRLEQSIAEPTNGRTDTPRH